jgi:nucleotide-binding universal stress UspA family protein
MASRISRSRRSSSSWLDRHRRRLPMGSKTEHVLRNSEVPVVVLRAR